MNMRPSSSIDKIAETLYEMNPEWRARCGNDFLLIHNPSAVTEDRHPFRPSLTINVFCTAGEASGTVNLKEFHLKKDCLLVIMSGQITETSYVSKDFKATYIIMSDAFFDGMNIGDGYIFYKAILEKPCLNFNKQASEAIMYYIQFCRNLLSYDGTPNQLEVLQLLTKVLYRAMGWSIHGTAIGEEVDSHRSAIAKEYLELVEANYTRHHDVAWYADKMNISPKYLTTVVKSESGKSAIKWIESHIIIDAKTRLATSRNQIQEISDSLGFPSHTIFGRYFKRKTGLSPTEYRSLATNNQSPATAHNDNQK
jgi:AraC family transcriptional activator of pobA